MEDRLVEGSNLEGESNPEGENNLEGGSNPEGESSLEDLRF